VKTYSYKQAGNQTKQVISMILTSFWAVGSMFLSFILFGNDSTTSTIFIVVNIILAATSLIVYTRKFLVENVTITLQDDFSFNVYYSFLNQTIRFTKNDIRKFKHGSYRIESYGKDFLWIWMKNPRYNLFIENSKDIENEEYYAFITHFVELISQKSNSEKSKNQLINDLD
jgi:hypothetical protein